VSPAGVVDQAADLVRSLDGPFQLLGQLGLGRFAAQLSAQDYLGPLVVLGGLDQPLRVSDGGLLLGERSLHASGDLPPAGRLELDSARWLEAADGFHQPESALLEEVTLAQSAVAALIRGPGDPVEVSVEQGLLGHVIAAGGGLQQTVVLGGVGMTAVPRLVGKGPDVSGVGPPEARLPRISRCHSE